MGRSVSHAGAPNTIRSRRSFSPSWITNCFWMLAWPAVSKVKVCAPGSIDSAVALQSLRDRLSIHRDSHGDEVVAGGVLDREDDRRDRRVDLPNATGALVAHVSRAARGGADQKLGARLAQLVLIAQRQRALGRSQAVGGGRVGGARRPCGDGRAGESGDKVSSCDESFMSILMVARLRNTRA